MSDTTEELAKVKQSLTSIRSALRTAGDQAVGTCGFWRSWTGVTKDLGGAVEELASQVRYLATNVETICQIIERNESSRSG